MNKKIRFIAPVLCGLILSSSMMATNVQAENIEKEVKNTQISTLKQNSGMNYIIPINQKYSVFCELGFSLGKVGSYIRDTLKKGITPTAEGIRNVLVEDGISKSIANNISYTLLSLADRNLDHDAFPEMNFGYGSGYTELILTVGDGNFAVGYGIPSVQNYSLYGIITHQDLVNLKKTIDENPSPPSESSSAYIMRMLIKSNIITDAEMAKIMIDVMGNVVNYSIHLDDVIESNESFYVLLADDKQHVMITRQPR